ncbi:MAG TPA: outer membrane beta-barrel protein, partial [Saprospiraceae bacterium]|nr:outer membrane beta-barrel protein [Saprospiraceae bacterium]
MKTKIIILAATMFASLFVNAQISVGVKTGINFADASLSGISETLLPDAKIINTPLAGVNLQYRINEQFSFQPELNYAQRGFEAKAGTAFNVLDFNIPVGIKAITKVNYIELPVQ